MTDRLSIDRATLHDMLFRTSSPRNYAGLRSVTLNKSKAQTNPWKMFDSRNNLTQ
jgi:hypothetical protein